MVNYVNLYELVQLHKDEKLSEEYVRYLANFTDEKMYHHHEITAINNLLLFIKLDSSYFDDFLYSYSLPQLSKEFDLMCITDRYVLNIELKSINTGDKIYRQLKQNAYFLKMLNKKILEYCYVDEDKMVYKYSNGELIEASFEEIQMFLSLNKEHIQIDLDHIYDVGSVLISPLKDPLRFIEDNYILTENQESTKRNILCELSGNNHYVAVTGNAGTGKTLLLYDLAKELALTSKVLIISCGDVWNEHKILAKLVKNLEIEAIKNINYDTMEMPDYILVDETHRIRGGELEKLEKYVGTNKLKCVFSFDERQAAKKESVKLIMDEINRLSRGNIYKLTHRIRANKDISAFINNLLDLTKRSKERMDYSNIKIIYEDSDMNADEKIKEYELKGYKYITYKYMVYDQEFDYVVMKIGDEFYYEGNKLKSYDKKNSTYSYVQLLYQGMNRVRRGLLLVVTNKEVLDRILTIIKRNK